MVKKESNESEVLRLEAMLHLLLELKPKGFHFCSNQEQNLIKIRFYVK